MLAQLHRSHQDAHDSWDEKGTRMVALDFPPRRAPQVSTPRCRSGFRKVGTTPGWRDSETRCCDVFSPRGPIRQWTPYPVALGTRHGELSALESSCSDHTLGNSGYTRSQRNSIFMSEGNAKLGGRQAIDEIVGRMAEPDFTVATDGYRRSLRPAPTSAPKCWR